MGEISAEPSMEEILSSIKRIIAEEGEVPTRQRRQPRPVPSPVAEADEPEILELRAPMPLRMKVEPAAARAAAAALRSVYYLFGDIPANSHRYVDVFRATGGISGDLGGGFKFRLNGVYARDNFSVTQRGFINIQGLLNAINTGAYNFVNPEQNTAAVRNQISPERTTPSYSTVATIGGSLLKSLMELPGGDLNVGAGFQIRRETLMNRNQNADLSYYGLNTSSAQGRQTVTAGFFEIDAPFLRTFDLNVSGRYDHYSQGYSHFSPKVGAKFTPVEQFSLRATYSQGFRAPTFAENNPASSYAGFSSLTPPASFVAAHPGNPAYTSTYNIGSGSIGNPDILPEVSRSFTAGTIFRPTRWFNLTVDYYNIKKSNLIVSGPLRAQAIAAYYGQTNATAGCAALAAVGPGYARHRRPDRSGTAGPPFGKQCRSIGRSPHRWVPGRQHHGQDRRLRPPQRDWQPL